MTLPGLKTTSLGRHWRHFEVLDSTNDYLKENAPGLPHGAAVTASSQTAGKGRLGRRWSAEPGESLALSVLLRGWRPEELGPLPLVAGLAVCEGVEALCGIPCAVKWSNDVLTGNRKLCGILCESRMAGAGADAVVGIGVNLHQTGDALARLGLVYATSLFLATGKRYGAPETAAAVLNALEPLLETCRGEGFGALRERYRGRCVTLGRTVRVCRDGVEREARSVDVAPDGALLCVLDGEIQAVHAGEVSVRGLFGYV